MNEVLLWTDTVNIILLVYVCVLFLVYLIMVFLSILEMRDNINSNRHLDYEKMLSFTELPSVSVIAPAYNEEKTIIENIKCLLALKYPNYELIIVNDGSKDDTLQKVIRHFGLVQTNRVVELRVPCANIKGVYQSTNPAFNHLTLIDKENGGKADALNAGINISGKDLFLAMDVDCIVEPDAIVRLVRPFLDKPGEEVVAVGGVIRVANSCEISEGRIVKVRFPNQFWAKFQAIEYMRSFILGRMAWSRINGLIIISGAFGMFSRQRVVEVGGYDKTTVGEDLELVVRLRKYMCEIGQKNYRVSFIPDPLCWTEVPTTFRILSRQRNRWTRGGIDTILKHRRMFLNPRYGIIGMLSFPYWVIFEWITPIMQVFCLLYLLFVIAVGAINMPIFWMFTVFSVAFSVLYTSAAVFHEARTYNRYTGMRYLCEVFIFNILEILVYQPVNTLFAISGNYSYFFKKNKKGWGEMTRIGFKSTPKK